MSGQSLAHWIVTAIGVFCTFVVGVLNSHILKKYVINKSFSKKVEFQLIFFRSFIDMTNGFVNCLYFILTVVSLLHPESLKFDHLFYMALFNSSVMETRLFLAAAIAIERVFATLFPINFYQYRKNVSNTLLVAFFVSTGAFTNVVLFRFCDFSFPLNPNCSTFVCASTPCYQNYSAHTRMICGSINAVFSSVLCIKLFTMRLGKHVSSMDLKRANLLSLADGLSSIVFEFLPSLLINYSLINITNLGPISGTLRVMGRTLEATVMLHLMGKQNVQIRTISTCTGK